MKFLFILITIFSLTISSYAKYNIVVIKNSNLQQFVEASAGFADTLKQKEGFDIIEYVLNSDLKEGEKIAKEINAKTPKPDLIYAIGDMSAYVAANKIQDIPIIFSMILNYKKKGLNLVEKKNVTGISLEVPLEITFIQMQMIVPGANKIGLIYSDKSSEIVEGIKQKKSDLGIELIEKKINSADEIEKAFANIKNKIQILYMVADPVVYTTDSTKFLIETCKKEKIPFIAYSDAFVKAGALLSISPSYYTIGSQAATIAENILVDKTPPEKIGVVSPIGTFFVINALTIEQLKLNVSPDVFGMADKVYKEESK
ncbi:MAG TPA: ABC transporter substrate binding protein [bacterium]|nr:ABC transporter substrate binding protein [bacterium]HOL48568.1 ABC transporter substrate binding protein [bacterium]HPQ19241.1 ABC transporter substrate binding protein [bacterium]